jgi:preprotein translocase SecF subunit
MVLGIIMFSFIKHKRIYFTFSIILILVSALALTIYGLEWGIDFTGGSILELNYKEGRPSISEVKESLNDFDLGDARVQFSGDEGIMIRTKDISEEVHQQVILKLREGGSLEELKFEKIGPIMGKELKQKTTLVAILSIIAILLYITIAFGRVSRPIASWQYGIASLIALSHDVLIPLGMFAVLGRLYDVQITIPVITALLTVIGYSINNTVVVFDRVRENLIRDRKSDFRDIVDKSLNETLTRSLNTSLTTLFVLFAIYFFGGETLRYFSLALITGLICGTYSSLFLAAPLLVSWLEWKRKN